LLNLIQDNNGLTVNDASFRLKYKADTDPFLLGNKLPADMFKATPLGQPSLVIMDTSMVTQVSFDFIAPTLPLSESDETLMFGEWTFALIPCVDRTAEPLGRLDCEHG